MNKNKEKSPKKTSNVINIGCQQCGNIDQDRAADIFAESIQEEIRQENWQKLWNKYGKFVTSVFVASLIIVGGYNTWQKHDLAEKEAISTRFTAVQGLIMDEQVDKAIDQIKELTTVSKDNYALLAKLEYAGLLLQKSDPKVLDIFKSIHENPKVDSLFKDLAYILYTNAALDLMDTKTLMKELDPIVKTISTERFLKGPWNIIARETLAFCYIKLGDNNMAKSILNDLAKTENIPAGIAERTRILIQHLGGE